MNSIFDILEVLAFSVNYFFARPFFGVVVVMHY